MRLAALLVLALPAAALAQSAPQSGSQPAKPPVSHPAEHKPSASTPSGKPAAKPTTAAPAQKAAPTKPGPTKPGPTKTAPRKPSPGKAPPPRPAPVAAPAAAPAEPPAEPTKGSNTGLPLPRFAALRSDDVNFRTGPGTRYPIEWIYKRRDLPVQIEREFEIWRLVRDQQGNKGWVNQATLTGRRTAVIDGGEHALRQSGADTAAIVAKLKPGVIIRIRSCEANSEWCQASITDYRGYIKRSEIWGVLPNEVIQ